MLKLIYPNAVSLDSYLEVWLRQIAAAAASGSSSASVSGINSSGGPASYLSREDDGPEFKKVSAVFRVNRRCDLSVRVVCCVCWTTRMLR